MPGERKSSSNSSYHSRKNTTAPTLNATVQSLPPRVLQRYTSTRYCLTRSRSRTNCSKFSLFNSTDCSLLSPGRSGEEWDEKGREGRGRKKEGEERGDKEGEKGMKRDQGGGQQGGRRRRSWCSFTCSQILDHRVGVENFLGSKQCILTVYSVVVLHVEGGSRGIDDPAVSYPYSTFYSQFCQKHGLWCLISAAAKGKYSQICRF